MGSNSDKKARESTQLLESMMKKNVDGSSVVDQKSSNSNTTTPSSSSTSSNSSIYTKTFIADALRAQYGLASLDEAYFMVDNYGLQHPVTLRDLSAAQEEWKREHEEKQVRIVHGER